VAWTIEQSNGSLFVAIFEKTMDMGFGSGWTYIRPVNETPCLGPVQHQGPEGLELKISK